MAIHKKNAFAARKQKSNTPSYEHNGQVTILGRPNSKVQKAFEAAVKSANASTKLDYSGGYDNSKLQNINYREDYRDNDFRDKLKEAGFKVRTNKYGKPTSITNTKDGSNYRISYGGRDANGKNIRMSQNEQGFDPKKASRLGAMGLSAG